MLFALIAQCKVGSVPDTLSRECECENEAQTLSVGEGAARPCSPTGQEARPRLGAKVSGTPIWSHFFE